MRPGYFTLRVSCFSSSSSSLLSQISQIFHLRAPALVLTFGVDTKVPIPCVGEVLAQAFGITLAQVHCLPRVKRFR